MTFPTQLFQRRKNNNKNKKETFMFTSKLNNNLKSDNNNFSPFLFLCTTLTCKHNIKIVKENLRESVLFVYLFFSFEI